MLCSCCWYSLKGEGSKAVRLDFSSPGKVTFVGSESKSDGETILSNALLGRGRVVKVVETRVEENDVPLDRLLALRDEPVVEAGLGVACGGSAAVGHVPWPVLQRRFAWRGARVDSEREGG